MMKRRIQVAVGGLEECREGGTEMNQLLVPRKQFTIEKQKNRKEERIRKIERKRESEK